MTGLLVMWLIYIETYPDICHYEREQWNCFSCPWGHFQDTVTLENIKTTCCIVTQWKNNWSKSLQLSHSMTKPTKWPDADQPGHLPSLISLRCPHEVLGLQLPTHKAHCEEGGYPGWSEFLLVLIPRLNWIGTWRKGNFVGFVVLQLNQYSILLLGQLCFPYIILSLWN